MRQSLAEAGEEAALVGALQLMLPNPQHTPAARAERAGDKAVAGAVGADLLPPKGGVGFGLRAVERAAVPEAAVDEDGELEAAETADFRPAT